MADEGTSLDVPDEERNREEFGLQDTKREQSAFPRARVTALLDIATRAAFAWACGPYQEAEATLATKLHPHLRPGMLLLAHRGYVGAAFWQSAAQTGADLLWRAERNTVLPGRRALDAGSFLSAVAGAWRGWSNTPRGVGRGALPLGDHSARPAAGTGRRTRRAVLGALGDQTAFRRDQDTFAGAQPHPARQDAGPSAAGGRRPHAGALRRAAPPTQRRAREGRGS